MSTNYNKTKLLSLLALLVLFFIVAEWQAAITLMMWIVVVCFCLLRVKERLLLLLFQTTLFTFLMTRLILPDFFQTGYIAADVDGTIRMFDMETLRFIYTTLAISIFGSYLGFVMMPKIEDEKLQIYDNNTPYVLSIRHISKILSYGCSFFFLCTRHRLSRTVDIDAVEFDYLCPLFLK